MTRSLKLSAKLKAKISTKSELSVLEHIDTACKVRTKFSFDKLKKAVKELDNYLTTHHDTDEYEHDEFMLLFFKVFNEVYAEQERATGYFHPSSILSDCPRRLYYEFTETPETDRVPPQEISPQTQRIFDCGTWWHTYIQMQLWKSGVLDKSELKVFNRRKKISGHTDGRLKVSGTKLVLEVKTINSFQFNQAKLRPLPKHEAQAGVYATELGMDTICFLYINKDTSEIAEHIVPVNKKIVGEAYDIMEYVLDSVKSELLPTRLQCSDITDKKACSCPYRTQCFKDPQKITH